MVLVEANAFILKKTYYQKGLGSQESEKEVRKKCSQFFKISPHICAVRMKNLGSLTIFCHHFAQRIGILSAIKHGDYPAGT